MKDWAEIRRVTVLKTREGQLWRIVGLLAWRFGSAPLLGMVDATEFALFSGKFVHNHPTAV